MKVILGVSGGQGRDCRLEEPDRKKMKRSEELPSCQVSSPHAKVDLIFSEAIYAILSRLSVFNKLTTVLPPSCRGCAQERRLVHGGTLVVKWHLEGNVPNAAGP